MKKLFTFLLVLSLLITGCASTKLINGHMFEPYGLVNKDKKEECIEYEVRMASIIWGVLLFETIIVPVILFGKKLYKPIKEKEDCNKKEQ